MRILDRVAARFGYQPAQKRRAPIFLDRGFSAGKSDRLTWSFSTMGQSINADLYQYLEPMRSRSRELWADNEYAARFIGLCKNNLVGPAGVRLQVKSKRPDGTLDTADNDRIERTWREWSKRGSCDVTGRLSRVAAERLFVETVVRDGECLIRIVDGFENAHGFAIQFIDVDRLDTQFNKSRDERTGNRIVMGVELDRWDRPVAYHILDGHPGSFASEAVPRHHMRIPAAEIIHGFLSVRPEQVRGVPWMHAAILGLKDLGGYREAAIVAARVGAAKMGFWRSPDGESGPYDDTGSDGVRITEAEAGTFDQIPDGVELETWDPQYPHGEFDAFNKAVLRGIAAGMGVAYHTLAQDLEGVNFSSARAGTLDERDLWQCLQGWMVESLHDAIYPHWLSRQLMIGTLDPLPMGRFDKFNAATWQPRRWPWVDPLKDEQSNALAYGMRTKSLRQIIAERGQDPDDVWAEMAEDEAKLRELGITPTLPNSIQIVSDPTEEGATNA